MNDLVQADIFFFITSIAVVVVTAGVLVLLYYAIKVARQVNIMAERAEKVEKEVEGDIEKVRASLKEEGVRTKAITDTILGAVSGVIASFVAPRKRRTRTTRPSSQH